MAVRAGITAEDLTAGDLMEILAAILPVIDDIFITQKMNTSIELHSVSAIMSIISFSSATMELLLTLSNSHFLH